MGNLQETAFIIALGAEVNNNEAALERSPLHIAAKRNDSDMAQLLIQAGASLDVVDIYGEQPIRTAFIHSSSTVFPLLLAEAPPRSEIPWLSPMCKQIIQLDIKAVYRSWNQGLSVDTRTRIYLLRYLEDLDSQISRDLFNDKTQQIRKVQEMTKFVESI